MNETDIERLLEKFDNSGLQELKIDGNGVDVYFSKLDKQTVVNQAPAASTEAEPVSASAKPKASENTMVKASMVGLVYFAPSPDKPPYKEVGDHVKKGETICAIEAMKLINEIKSPVSGIITKRIVSDGEMVEFDQPMFEIKED
ncbi:biotin/lipoyl-containing protein [Fructilactobacillus vespulae]|uniref:acetyl-CoA carboxylase biotin carboxyl carrier protein n=1 Tax=Fructilactobacillus vespulae TaxID=1249630 RepID=UPI0039B4E675